MSAAPAPGAGLRSVLVVSGGGFQGLAALEALAELPGVRAVVADALAHPLSVGLAHETVLVPPVAAGEAFLEALLALCGRHAIDVVLPCSAHELRTLARAQERFEAVGARVAVCPEPLLGALLDKRECAGWLRAAGLPVLDEIDPESADAPFPLIAKPRDGSGGRGVAVLPDRGAWNAQRERGLSPHTHVLQRYLSGCDELSVDFAIDFEGRVSALLGRQRLRVSGGYAVVSETADDAAVLQLVGRLAVRAAAAGGRGAFNVQVLRSAQMTFVSDVNPRLGTSSTHWVGSGVSLLAHLLGHPGSASSPAIPSVGLRRRSLRRLQDSTVPVDIGFESHAAEVRGVVFDLDDTLIPQKRWMLARLEAALASLAPALTPERGVLLDAALRLIEEGRAASLFDDLAAACGLEPPARDALLAAYRRSAPPRCAVYDDVEAVLETLRRRGFRLGLLTDNPPESQERKLAASGLAERFDAVVFSRLHGGEKPAAGGFQAMEAALGLAAPRLAMVGNNPYRDAGGALRAGWGAAYLVRRAGSMCDFDHGLYSRTLPATARLRVLNGLTELLPHLVGLG